MGAISTKVFQTGVEKNSLVLPQGSLFTSDFTYAIDTSSNFYRMSTNNYVSQKITQLKSTPLYLKWSSVLKALITITKNSDSYSLYVIDPANSANFYSKTFVKGTDYTGDLQYTIRSTFGSILMKDETGFVTFIKLKLVDSLIVPYTFTLEQSTYSPIFNP